MSQKALTLLRDPAATPVRHLQPADLRGYARLAVDATQQVAGIVEAIHQRIARPGWLFGAVDQDRTQGITGLVYRSVQEIAGAVGLGIDQTLKPLVPLLTPAWSKLSPSPAREGLIAALNGVLGDHLERSGNPLAQAMELRHGDQTLSLEPDALRRTIPNARAHLVVVVHGLCMNDRQWRRDGYSHCDALAPALDASVVQLRYNSGRHISQNGRDFADALERLLAAWPQPVKTLTLLTHSMGGLVARSACHYAERHGHRWRSRLQHLVMLGTPHHGAPLERGGNRLQYAVGLLPYAAPLARLGMLRSAGVTDLRYGSLVDEDWQQRDRFAGDSARPQCLPLPQGVRCYAAAATLGAVPGDAKDQLLGDGLVPLASALGRELPQPIPTAQTALFVESSHWDLLYRREVGDQILRWLAH